MNEDQVIEKIFQTLLRQKFADWYNSGRFDQWISGDLPGIEDEEIKEDIRNLFGLKNEPEA